jgi:hypothetical protein
LAPLGIGVLGYIGAQWIRDDRVFLIYLLLSGALLLAWLFLVWSWSRPSFLRKKGVERRKLARTAMTNVEKVNV